VGIVAGLNGVLREVIWKGFCCMASKKGRTPTRRELRNLRTQQIVFIVIGVLVILSMIISLVVN
jgi:hypothetical protein